MQDKTEANQTESEAMEKLVYTKPVVKSEVVEVEAGAAVS